MTQQSWDNHKQHLDDHITWPATKTEIMAACNGTDVEPEVLEEIKTTLPDDDTKYTQQEFKQMLVV